MRYAHNIVPLKSSHWPARVLCLDTAPEGGAWHVAELKAEGAAYVHSGSYSGATAAAFWEKLIAATKRRGKVLIVSARASDSWHKLGLWDALDAGACSLIEPEMRTDGAEQWAKAQLDARRPLGKGKYSCGDIRREIEKGTGYLVMRDPPCCAMFCTVNPTVWLTWIGISNYGVELPEAIVRGQQAAQWVAATFRRIRAAVGEYRLGAFNATAGGLALNGYKTGYYGGGLVVTGDYRQDAIESASYYGGRSESAVVGRVQDLLWCFDCRCAYPAICATVPVPVRCCNLLDYRGAETGIGRAEAESAIATVTLRTDWPLYPCRQGDRVIYPVGTFRTTLAAPELVMAMDRGHVLRWWDTAQYVCKPLLVQYATALYELRCQAENREDVEIAAMAKLLLNSLVGRFAKRDIRWRTVLDQYTEQRWGHFVGADAQGNSKQYRSIGGQVEEEVDAGLCADAQPAIAAWVTSQARVNLLSYIETAGRAHVYYWDTDCVMVDEYGRRNLLASELVEPKALGYLSERWGPEQVEIHGIKYYSHGDTVVCAGMPAGLNIDSGDGLHYVHDYTPAEDVRKGQKPHAHYAIYSYGRYAEYRHGTVDKHGIVSPFRLEEE